MQKRMISVILCLTLLIGMLPAAVAVVPGMKGGKSTNVGNSEGLQDLTIEDGIAAVRFNQPFSLHGTTSHFRLRT